MIRRFRLSRSANSAPHRYRALSRLFRFLVAEEVLTVSPTLRLRPAKVEQKVRYGLTPAELQTCYKAVKSTCGFRGIRDTAIFALLVGSGLRASELTGLRDRDVDLVHSQLLKATAQTSCALYRPSRKSKPYFAAALNAGVAFPALVHLSQH